MSERAFVVKEGGCGEDGLSEALRNGHAVKSITVIGTSALVVTHEWFSPSKVVVDTRHIGSPSEGSANDQGNATHQAARESDDE